MRNRPLYTAHTAVLCLVGILFALAWPGPVWAQEDPPPAPIVNDEGGPVSITGQVTYTNPRFTLGVAEPLIILEDQAGFVDRNERYIMPVESQTIGQITSDFYTSPFTYSLALPIEPKGAYRDVDNDDQEDRGVQIFAVAYWNNTFGDPFLEERDLFGGGWSTAYASTRVSEEADKEREIVGGKFIVYAPDDRQGFPSDFGPDGLLFTGDEPIVTLPQGYTVVDMDTSPFTFDRSRYPVIDLIEPESAALVDFSELGYVEAFDALIDLLSKEYAFTEYKGIDWERKRREFRPRFQAADNLKARGEVERARQTYLKAFRDFVWSIPDGHLSPPFLVEEFLDATWGGVGLAIQELDDGRVIAVFVLEDSPADRAGIRPGTEIRALDGVPIQEVIENAVAWSAPFSTPHVERLQKARYATRFPRGTDSVAVTFVDDEGQEVTEVLEVIPERESFLATSFNVGLTGFELPVEFRQLEGTEYGYVKIYSFADNTLLTVQLWERMIRDLNEEGVSGLIIDMRQNSGGRGFLADQMAAYFFDEPHVLGNTGYYDKGRGEFYFDPVYEDRFYLPPEDLRYRGRIAVLIGPNCNSACEFFTYDMTIEDRAAIVGMYPTAGLGGSTKLLKMPGEEFFQFTAGRAVDPNGEIHIEGKGVAPTVRVPVTEETVLAEGDPVLDAAVAWLDEVTQPQVEEAGELTLGDTVEGELEPGVRVRYRIDLEGDTVVDIRAQGQGLDPVVYLYLGDRLVAQNDSLEPDTQGAGFLELEIPRDLTLTIEIGSLGDLGQGTFTLTVEETER